MKQLLLSLFTIATTLSASAQNILVPAKHKTVMMKFTADWCGPCGLWAWGDMETLINDSKSGAVDAICIAVHNQASDFDAVKLDPAYADYRPNLVNDENGIPTFAVSNVRVDLPDVAKVEAAIATEAAKPAEANAGFLATWNAAGDEVTVNTKTTFFTTASGTYAVGVYMYEDNIYSPQQGQGNGIYPSVSVYHHNVLRSTTSGSGIYGTPLAATSFTQGTSIDNSITIPKPALSNKANITLFTIVWKQNNGKWEVVNANDMASFPASVNSVDGTSVLTGIFPNPSTGKFTLALGQSIENCTINLLDVTGKKVAELYSGAVNRNAIAIQLERPAAVPGGTYILSINSNKGHQAMKLELQ